MSELQQKYIKLAKEKGISDLEKKWDNTLTEIENLENIFGSYPIENQNYNGAEETSFNRTVMENMWEDISEKNMWNSINRDVKSIVIVGNPRTGKTSLGYKILESFDRVKYIFKHPKPSLISKLGFKQMSGLGEIENLQDCVIWIDEPQLYIKLYEKKGNNTLMRLLSLCGQRNITLILSTSNTRFITRGVESYIDVWLVKDLEFDMVKQGSMIKKIVKDYVYLDTEGFSIDINEYLFYSRQFKKFNGKHNFELPEYFNDELSKPYRIPTKTANISPTKTPN